MKFVTYKRVSTKEQGYSGLGLAAQQDAIENYTEAAQGLILAEYVDIQSGRKDDRSGLQRALRACRVHGATLLVSKLCRLSRSFAFSANLLEGQVPIIICENPNASALELRLKAAINQEERERISKRTREALAAKLKRGESLGNKDVWRYARNQNTSRANEARKAKADDFKLHTYNLITEHFIEELPSLTAIAQWLNESGHKTPRGKEFTRTAVNRILNSEPR